MILIVSVNGTKQYQGFARMKEDVPIPQQNFDGLANDVPIQSRLSEPFKIDWICR